MLKKNIAVLLFLSCQLLLFAEMKEYLLDNCNDVKMWGISFPGAKGSKKQSTPGKISVNYDFTKGGRYIVVWPKTELLSELDSFYLKVKAAQDCSISYRIIDATGRFFQGKAQNLTKSQSSKIIFKTSGPWSAAWGGKKSASPVKPFKRFLFMILKRDKLPKQGSVQLESFGISSNKDLKVDFVGQGADLTACNWNIKTEWVPQLRGGLLKIDVKSKTPKAATLSINFPKMVRDNIFRKKLLKNETFYYRTPLKNKNNIYNQYKLILKIANLDTQAQTILTLAGRKSKNINFGAPVNSKKIKASPIGVVTHFSGNKGPWRQYEKLIDGIADCGTKWIRDSVWATKQKDGSYKIKVQNLKWIKYAKSKGLNIIALIIMVPDKSLEEYKKYVEAIVKDTRGIVGAYELGNEPHNYGWRKKFGGRWNGYNTKTKKIDKWVIEQLNFTNKLADHIKKINPNAIVVGLGACSPTNFFAIKTGLSKNVDGVVDHAYTYSMPPEKIPFSKKHFKRDGIIVSEDGSFAELIKSYKKLFIETGIKRSIWLTEFGFPTFWFNGKNEKSMYAAFTEETQAVYLIRRFIMGIVLDVAAICSYDYLNDYNSTEYNPEANFGIIRTDYSRKPAYYAIQRMNSLFNGYKFDKKSKVIVEKQVLHRSCRRVTLVNDWDKVALKANNEVRAYAFENPNLKTEKMLAIWSAQPYSREFNNRVCTIRVKNMTKFKAQAIAIDIITGRSYDISVKRDKNDFILDDLVLKGHPIVVKFFK